MVEMVGADEKGDELETVMVQDRTVQKGNCGQLSGRGRSIEGKTVAWDGRLLGERVNLSMRALKWSGWGFGVQGERMPCCVR